ncbi:MAG: DUF2815 family protein [Acutalibacteraceae bacterium]|nr:DUF2815 family protein [Acutalibacteraceae bacterium]
MSDTIVTGEVRLSYVNVFTPRAPLNGGDAKYSVTLLIPKSDFSTKQSIDSAINQAIQEAVANGIKLPPTPRLPIHDGDGVRASGEVYGDECKGHWVLTASSLNKPEVVDASVQPILSPAAVYSGCYGRVSIRFYGYDKAGSKGIACGLGNVQKLRDGEPLSGGTTAKQDFGQPIQPAPQQTYGQSPVAPQQPQQPQYTQYTQPQPAPQYTQYTQPQPAPPAGIWATSGSTAAG